MRTVYIRLVAALFVFVFPSSVFGAFEPLTPAGMFPAGFEIGDLVKAPEISSVYYLGADGRLHFFPNARTYFSWYDDYSGIKTISLAQIAQIPLGTMVTYRPGVKMIKLQISPTVYAVSRGGVVRAIPDEATARRLYGENWNQQIDDVNDVFWPFYKIGTPLGADYSPQQETANTPTINVDKGLEVKSVFRSFTLTIENGQSFPVRIAELARSQFDMITDTATLSNCNSGCPAKTLEQYVEENSGAIGFHGTYFCPPDYPECEQRVNYFAWPVYNTAADVMINENALGSHAGPLLASSGGELLYFHRAKDFGRSVEEFESRTQKPLDAAIAHFPSLVESGNIVVFDEPRLDDGMKTIQATRAGIGYNKQYVMLIIASGATVPDLARIFAEVGADFAMNVDGGGSTALYMDGRYIFGPGRLLPNAIIFRAK